MALSRVRCACASNEIHEVDHGPPHCHVSGLAGAGSAVVSLITLETTKPPGLPLPVGVRRCLRENQEAMLEAREHVISFPERRD